MSSLESQSSRERFNDSAKIYNQGLTERLNLGKHGSNLFYSVNKADNYVTNSRKRQIKFSFPKEQKLKDDLKNKYLAKLPGPAAYEQPLTLGKESKNAGFGS